ncbi:hypothetical protein LCGC14_0432650 [marine sediment metagenome]|uniref:Uncharacterized protein n=1 Tax=marine sediment metagenome TaxID=412755 RepID=A0A0F9SMJ1_9ZZZZ
MIWFHHYGKSRCGLCSKHFKTEDFHDKKYKRLCNKCVARTKKVVSKIKYARKTSPVEMFDIFTQQDYQINSEKINDE